MSLVSIDPPEPMVGDDVRFSFDTFARLPGSWGCDVSGSRCTFVGGAPVLEGDDRPAFEDGFLVVRRRAVQSGVATVHLDISGMTEEACRFETETGCNTFFQYATIEASSGPIEVTVSGLPTPTATSTATPTATPTFTASPPPNSDDDGCAIGAAPRTNTIGLALFLLPIIVLRVRRSR